MEERQTPNHGSRDPSSLMQCIVDRYPGDSMANKKCAGIVILGEVENCVPLMEIAPFPSFRTTPIATQIFQMKKS
jgi:hypothetical protein